MRRIPTTILLTFAAGAFGGLVNSLAIWAAGALSLTAMVGVGIAPNLSPAWLYPRIVWGGLWGFAFLMPVLDSRIWLRALLFSLGPTLVQLFVVFPAKTPHGAFGLGLGTLTPVVVLLANAVWGLTAAAALRATDPGP